MSFKWSNSTFAYANATNYTSLGENTTSIQANYSVKCASFYGLSYKYYGSFETLFWSISSISIVSLNACSLYKNNCRSHSLTLYRVLLNCLMSSNLFAGIVIHPFLGYLSSNYTDHCPLLTFLMGCCVFNIVATLLLTTLITINRFVIVNSFRIVQQNTLFKNVTTAKSNFIYCCILLTCLFVTLLRVYIPNIGSILLPVLGIIFAIVTIALLYIILCSINRIPQHNDSQTSMSELFILKRSICVLRLLVLSIFFSWLPLVVIITATRVFKLNNQPTIISLAAKLFWIRPVVDPICQFFLLCVTKPVRQSNVVAPVRPQQPYELKIIKAAEYDSKQEE